MLRGNELGDFVTRHGRRVLHGLPIRCPKQQQQTLLTEMQYLWSQREKWNTEFPEKKAGNGRSLAPEFPTNSHPYETSA